MKKKIAILIPRLGVGGAERLIIEELSILKESREFEFEVHVVFGTGILFPHLKNLGIKLHVWDTPHKSAKILITYYRIINHLRANHFDVLHCHLLNSIGPLIGRIAGIKMVITTAHNDRKYSFTEKFGLRRNNLVIACGRQVAKNLKNFIPEKKIKILSNAIGAPLIQKTNILEGYNTTGKIICMAIGLLTEQKGYDILIQAVLQVKEAHNDFILFIAGEGKERKNIEELIEKLGLSTRIILLGVVDDIHSVLPHVDIFINSSKWEGLPMTLIEAIAHGLPLIATNVGGNSEIVIENETGLLVEPEDPSALSQAILRLLSDGDFRLRLGKGASLLFEEQYRIEQHCRKLTGIYSG